MIISVVDPMLDLKDHRSLRPGEVLNQTMLLPSSAVSCGLEITVCRRQSVSILAGLTANPVSEAPVRCNHLRFLVVLTTRPHTASWGSAELDMIKLRPKTHAHAWAIAGVSPRDGVRAR